MAKPLCATTLALKATFCLLLAITLSFASSARVLDEVEPQDPTVVDPPATSTSAPITTLPSGQVPATTGVAPTSTVDDEVDPPDADVESPVVDAAPITPPVTVAAPIPVPTTTTTPAPTVASSATVANPVGGETTAATTAASTSAPLSFFMHDILGGTHPSVRVVTGIIARTDINGIPFSVPNNNFFPLQGGTPLPNVNNINNFINPNTAPLITGLNPGVQSNTVLQNSGNNNNVVNGNNQPFVTAGQIPSGSTLQKIMFGSITVIDDELTEGHELGSTVLGRAQGFYLASSLDGTSHTMALTVLLHGENNHGIAEDSISFFGVHRTASPESQIAVIGGTGKYENAKGYATVETLPPVDQHTTDGVDTVMHFTVHLSE
ncbi:hypothetical protein P3X46_014180 [Hevea brasiliensis]|uniref:Dirigent protein n=1 Tax=Hevea brasiliensis TaxID=3981 RepID=A0ABQ9M9P5_HEVBR|nr:dirigent protein 9-like [Hevea brasiliensis]KAJ9175643.1 hypothetical protein P3X46_014180 [Hevea brasiliensis]